MDTQAYLQLLQTITPTSNTPNLPQIMNPNQLPTPPTFTPNIPQIVNTNKFPLPNSTYDYLSGLYNAHNYNNANYFNNPNNWNNNFNNWNIPNNWNNNFNDFYDYDPLYQTPQIIPTPNFNNMYPDISYDFGTINYDLNPPNVNFYNNGYNDSANIQTSEYIDMNNLNNYSNNNTNNIKNELLAIINNYRAMNGRGSLSFSTKLNTAAQWLSDDMARNNYLNHTDSLGRDFGTRLNAFGYTYNTYKGENIAAGTNYNIGMNVFNGWRNSPGHNRNMLDPNFKAIGIGISYNPNSNYRYYWANNFGGQID